METKSERLSRLRSRISLQLYISDNSVSRALISLGIPFTSESLSFGTLYKTSKANFIYRDLDINQPRIPHCNAYILNSSLEDDIVKSIIEAKLFVPDKKLMARKLRFSQIAELSDMIKFYDENHILGKNISPLTFALLDENNEIVQAISFIRQYVGGELVINLTRNATRKGVSVTGGFTKIFSNAIKILKEKYPTISKIVTYAIRDLTIRPEDAVYFRNGFKFLGDSGPTLEYYSLNKQIGHKVLFNRQGFMKAKLNRFNGMVYEGATFEYDERISEKNNLVKLGVYQRFNSGCWKFEYHL